MKKIGKKKENSQDVILRESEEEDQPFTHGSKQVTARMLAEGAIQEVSILPLDIQMDFLKQTEEWFLNEKDNRKFRKRIAGKDVTRQELERAIKNVQRYIYQLDKTASAVNNAVTMMHAELDSRDIGKEPSDTVLIKDERARGKRLERYRQRLRAKGGAK